jgi:hypothetical protein
MALHHHPWRRLFFAVTAITVSCSTVPTVPVTPPPPEKSAEEKAVVKEVVSWELSPAEGFADGYGYVTMEYMPPDGEPSRPAGGRITIHLGRRGLEHANTAWYGFTVVEGSTTLLGFAGREGIPNVKGPDGNWWNDVALDLPAPISREISVTVEDRKIGASYVFTVRRLVRPSVPAD